MDASTQHEQELLSTRPAVPLNTNGLVEWLVGLERLIHWLPQMFCS